MHLSSPTSVEEAIDLLSGCGLPVDSPTQHRIRSLPHLRDTFDSGRRRPEWVWALRRASDEPPVGVVGAFGTPYSSDEVRPMILDLFGLPDDPDTARILVDGASAEAVRLGADEALLFAPSGTAFGDDAVASVVSPLAGAGWRLLVERRHYEFEPPPDLGRDHPTELTFERLGDPADPRLAVLHREVMRDTLDAHDRDLIERLGFEGACRESLAYLLDADPVDCIHLALDPAGAVAGMVSGIVTPTRRGVVLFVGVGRDHRCRGYGRELLAWQSRRLLEAGATVLIADTDNTNLPMARGFADVGWPQTETRIDLVR